ncbi:MAG TPA: MerR family transcriptional regulator [Solirubrobacteraceae bacterium]|nr:MerR family transcriptional regulator [Solirubrobacteraceae bacterium]
MDTTGQTVSASRFAALTGVSRERLRTWERRHGFPRPHREGGGPRRYALADVTAVLFVRRAAESGMPLERAIRRARAAGARAGLSPAGFAGLVDDAPLPVVVLSGPAPLRVEYVNAALRRVASAPRPGEDLASAVPAFHDHPALPALAAAFTRDAGAGELEHPAWDGDARRTLRSAVFRLPPEPDARPLVALVGLGGAEEGAARVELAALRREHDDLRRREERHSRWLDGLAALAATFQRDPGPAVLEDALDVVIRQTNAVDAGLARYVSGRLELPGSRRGLLDAAAMTIAVHPDVAHALRDGEPLWLDAPAARALGLPPGLHASGVPVAVAGEPLGLVVFLFNEVEPHDRDNRRVLAAISAAMGFALLRDRLVAELRAVTPPGRPSAGATATGG